MGVYHSERTDQEVKYMEENWIAQLKADEETALETIIQHRSGYVYTIIRNFSRGRLSPEDMEELTADVFVQLWRNRSRLKADALLSPYLAAIARNAVKNRFRAMGKHAPVRQSLEELTLSDPKDLCGDTENLEAIACLMKGLDMLSETDREMIIRFYFYGEKTSEIAQMLSLTDTAVRLRLHRSRGKLRKFMIERGFDHAE